MKLREFVCLGIIVSATWRSTTGPRPRCLTEMCSLQRDTCQMSSSLCCACLHKCLTTPSTNIQPTTTITSPTDMAARSRSSMVSYSSSVSNTIGYNLTTPNGSPSYSTFKSLMENSLSSTRSFTCSTSFMSISSCSCTRVCESGNSSNNTQNIPVVFHASYITTIVVLLTIIFILGACLAYQRRITARIIKDQHEMPEQRVTEMEDRYKTEEHHQFSESLPYAEPADYCEPVSIYRQVTEDTNTPDDVILSLVFASVVVSAHGQLAASRGTSTTQQQLSMNITTGAYTQLDDAAVSHTDDYEAVGLVEVSQKEKKKEEEVEEGEKKNRKETGLEEKEGEVLEEVKET